jgi:hypothetical protein
VKGEVVKGKGVAHTTFAQSRHSRYSRHLLSNRPMAGFNPIQREENAVSVEPYLTRQDEPGKRNSDTLMV